MVPHACATAHGAAGVGGGKSLLEPVSFRRGRGTRKGGGGGRGRELRQGVIIVDSDESAPEPMVLADRFRAQVLMVLDAGGIADEEFLEISQARNQTLPFHHG